MDIYFFTLVNMQLAVTPTPAAQARLTILRGGMGVWLGSCVSSQPPNGKHPSEGAARVLTPILSHGMCCPQQATYHLARAFPCPAD
jgi:hypothetical protein